MTDFAARVSRIRVKGGADVRIIEPRGNDIPAKLREFAAEVERGEHGHVESMCSVMETGDGIQLYGWGNIDGLRSIGMFQLGIQKLTGIVLAEIDD